MSISRKITNYMFTPKLFNRITFNPMNVKMKLYKPTRKLFIVKAIYFCDVYKICI